MAKSTKQKVLIVGSLLVIAGVGGYFLYKWWKNKKESKKLDEGVVPTTEPTTSPVSTVTSPFTSAEDVKKFQDWMDAKHPKWVNGKNLNKGGGYGNYGPSTQKAWAKYGSEYTTSTPAVVTAPTTLSNLTDVLAANINGANGKTLIAGLDNLPIYNMNNQASGVTTKNQTLGTVVSATNVAGVYMVTFKDANGVKYKVAAKYNKVQL